MIPIHDIAEVHKKELRMNQLVTLTHYDSSEAQGVVPTLVRRKKGVERLLELGRSVAEVTTGMRQARELLTHLRVPD